MISELPFTACSRRRTLLLGFGSAFVLSTGCADVLGVEPLTGDAGDAAAEGGGCAIAWVDASAGAVPAGAVPNPVPGSTAKLYVCRVPSPALGVVPGKLLPGFACYYGDGHSELIAQAYQVLVPDNCSLAWEPGVAGAPPVYAVASGTDVDGGALYSCRVGTSGADPGEIGHVGPSTGQVCVYSLGGQSLDATDFDWLTAR